MATREVWQLRTIVRAVPVDVLVDAGAELGLEIAGCVKFSG